MKESVQSTLHWAAPRPECSLPPPAPQPGPPAGLQAAQGHEDPEVQPRRLARQDSTPLPTRLLINKCDHQELRRKFRNYEI